MKSIIFTMIFFSLLLNSCTLTPNILQNTNTGITTNTNATIQEQIKAPQINQQQFDTKKLTVKTWIDGLDTPWGIVFLNNNTALVTQRNGNIVRILNGKLQKEIYWKADSKEIGEGGLMGIEKDPNFKNNNYIYVMYTYENISGELKNKVVRLINNGTTAKLDRIIIDNIPSAIYHDGGRIKFGPDKKLYISTGDANNHPSAQDLKSLAGKILRLNADGSIPADNPFKNSPIYSYGHRNPQGIAFEPNTGDIFISSHGPTGEYGLTKRDRIDYIIPGGNYGRPLETGYSDKYKNPIILWDKEGNPPAGIAFWHNILFVTTLKSQKLIAITLEKENETYKAINTEELYKGTYGRLRDAVVGPDNNLYVLTSNLDSRGDVKFGSDKVLIIKSE